MPRHFNAQNFTEAIPSKVRTCILYNFIQQHLMISKWMYKSGNCTWYRAILIWNQTFSYKIKSHSQYCNHAIDSDQIVLLSVQLPLFLETPSNWVLSADLFPAHVSWFIIIFYVKIFGFGFSRFMNRLPDKYITY